MKIINTIAALQEYLQAFRGKKTIGFVPTMGALHEGHLSLIAASTKKCDITVVSIFVNPTQFNNPEDFECYPRCMEEDIELMQAYPVDVVFTPSEQEIYPTPDNRKFHFGEMERVMEGAFRPGHFNGVAQVVSKLFEYCQPDYAFFGEKDFQQLAIIRELVWQQHYPVQIVGCPIVREKDGLAMSSRNRRLSAAMRNCVPVIAQTLFEAKEKMQQMNVMALKEWALEKIGATEGLDPEYVEVVNARTLHPIKEWNEAEQAQMCVAVWASPVRLIDNIHLK